jgi:hypothetical protein
MTEIDGQFHTMAIVKYITIVVKGHKKWKLGDIPQNDKGQENNETSFGKLAGYRAALIASFSRHPHTIKYDQGKGKEILSVRSNK